MGTKTMHLSKCEQNHEIPGSALRIGGQLPKLNPWNTPKAVLRQFVPFLCPCPIWHEPMHTTGTRCERVAGLAEGKERGRTHENARALPLRDQSGIFR